MDSFRRHFLLPQTRLYVLVPRMFRIAAVAGVLVGICVAVWGVFLLVNAAATSDWPFVEGQVVESVMAVGFGVRAPGQPAGQRRLGNKVPRIRYTYTVDGRQYESRRISLAGGRIRGEPLLQRYPQGRKVRVYYDPDDPGRAILQTGVGLNAWLPLIAGGGFVLFSAIFYRIGRSEVFSRHVPSGQTGA